MAVRPAPPTRRSQVTRFALPELYQDNDGPGEQPMRYRLRTLLLLLAILPPLLAFGWWEYSAWKAEQERIRAADEIDLRIQAAYDELLPPPTPPTVGSNGGLTEQPPDRGPRGE